MLHDTYKWTLEQIDNTELGYLFDLRIVASKVIYKTASEKECYVDEAF